MCGVVLLKVLQLILLRVLSKRQGDQNLAFSGMKPFSVRFIACVILCLMGRSPSWSAHPLVSDDTGTQGPGGNQIELNADWVRDAGSTSKLAALTYTRGLTENLDVFADLPRTWGAPSGEAVGFNDISLGLKWRFFEEGGFSLGIKPVWITSSADENRGLGNGKSSYGLTVMMQIETDEFMWLFNLGTTRNRYKLSADIDSKRSTVNQSSVALLYRLPSGTTMLADLGQADAQDRTEYRKPKFLVIGLIHAVKKDFDIDIGHKRGLNAAESDYQWGAGLTWRFSK